MPKNSERTILVTGATGQQGGAVYRHLQKKGFKLRILVRDPDSPKARELIGHGEESFRGDLDDYDSIARALDGVYGVYSVQPFTHDAASEIKQGFALVEAANKQDITHFVYSSVVGADEHTGIAHFDSKGEIEEHLRNSGLNYTIFRPVFFMENWQSMFGDGIKQGQISLPLSPTTKLQMIAVDDIGAFVAHAFEHPGKWKNRIFPIAGDEYSMQEVADAFTRVTTHDVKYNQVPWDAFEQQAGHEMAAMFRWFEAQGYHVDIDAARVEYAQLATFNRWLEKNWQLTTSAGS